MGEVIPERKGEWVFVEGGMGSISRILGDVCREQGVPVIYDLQVQIEVNKEVTQILVPDGAAGVQCADGSTYYSDRIISNCTPRVTFDLCAKYMVLYLRNYSLANKIE
jgi:phytoene dehydrogenase-like protein